MTKDITRKLSLSHLTYCDNDINPKEANKLIVYRYHLILDKESKAKDWQTIIGNSIDTVRSVYLLRHDDNGYGLYICVDDIDTTPPTITLKDGLTIHPSRINYCATYNPIWLRLILRKLNALKAQCKGAQGVGTPLFVTDIWESSKSSGINAISIDCTTRQLADKKTTNVILQTRNVQLRPLQNPETRSDNTLWVLGANQVLTRIRKYADAKQKQTVFVEVKGKSKIRKSRPFLDVSSASKLEKSWPMIIKPLQQEFIEIAKQYGFTLVPKILNLKPLPIKTKSKSLATSSAFTSMRINGEINVIDLRVNQYITTSSIIDKLARVCEKKSIPVTLQHQVDITHDNIESYVATEDTRTLILLDQIKLIDDDRYLLTRKLNTESAIQHLNINPYDVLGTSVETGMILEITDNENKIIARTTSNNSLYYTYTDAELSSENYIKALSMRLDVSLKELEIKNLLYSKERSITQTLPMQTDCLNENIITISDCHLFTVVDDRPHIIVFDSTDEKTVSLIDKILRPFDLTTIELIMLIDKNWPYHFGKSIFETLSNSHSKGKIEDALSRLTLVISRDGNGYTHIAMQDPTHFTPHLIPNGIEDAISTLRLQSKKHPLNDWVIQFPEKFITITNELVGSKTISPATAKRLETHTQKLIELWHEELISMQLNGIVECDYRSIKKPAYDKWLKLENKSSDTSIIGAWDSVVSRYFEKPLKDIKGWLRDTPGITKVWYDPDELYFIVGSLLSPQNVIEKKPSIRKWHAIKGEVNPELIASLIDVDWMRMNQMAGNPCTSMIINRWLECNNNKRGRLLLS